MMQLYRRELDSPIGRLSLLANDQALVRIDFPDEISEEANLVRVHPILDLAYDELTAYFNRDLKGFSVPLFMDQGTVFQQEVWQALRQIPYGQTASYKDLAQAVNRPKAYRAVGAANNRNPLPIIIPCHRVIGVKGQLVGYRGGLAIKQFLLNLEIELDFSD